MYVWRYQHYEYLGGGGEYVLHSDYIVVVDHFHDGDFLLYLRAHISSLNFILFVQNKNKLQQYLEESDSSCLICTQYKCKVFMYVCNVCIILQNKV